MKNSPPSFQPHRQRGVALVIVLCFVVLITGLVVAYFSRTLTTRQLASASTSGTQAELLANSATDVILGDLKQEISDTTASTVSAPPASLPGASTVYVPTAAKYAVPQRNLSPTAADAIPNLIRTSLRSDSMAAPGIGSRASVASSATASVNGHTVSRPRWNRHFLIPTTTDPGAAPALSTAPVDAFPVPDWVFVTSDKGPVVLPAFSSAATSTVTGRYAYAVYDEGGLLDINHTGYPSASTVSHIGAKPVPSYADLTQLGLTQTNVDNLLGWRNYATLQPPTMPGFPSFYTGSQSVGGAQDTAYYKLFTSNLTNLLQVSTASYNSNTPNKTDQMFLSRQQLINYFATAGVDAKYLQYLGTFNRNLNQPSYMQETKRPKVLASTAGGNDAGDNNANPSTNLTPNFLTARVINAFVNPSNLTNPNTRYDGTPVVIGEPLMKKRFPLNRLAWLTYKGPSVNRSVTDPDMAQLIANGITADFLKQGTADNIKTYFGLTWDPASKWTYVHNSGNPILNISNPSSSQGTDVVHQMPGREPDFFELLKASINPGSIAKTSLSSAIDNNSIALGARYQRAEDVSLDVAILQIGANIIDQFDTDSFPTQINYDLGNTKLGPPSANVVYGVENLPYISRVRSGLLRMHEADPPECVAGSTPDTRPFKNTGVAALMYYPELWNPHDWSVNSANTTESLGTVGPKNFTVYAKTTDYGTGNPTPDYIFVQGSGDASWDANPDDSVNPGFHSLYGFKFSNGSAANPGGGETRTLSYDNTRMTFVMDTTSPANGILFREPTVLFQPNIPKNINLASPVLVPSNAALDSLSQGTQKLTLFSTDPAGGLLSDVTGTAQPASPYTYIPTKGSSYIGFYIGAHPLRWFPSGYKAPTGTNPPYPAQGTVTAVQTQYGPYNDVTFYVTCDDGVTSGGTISYDIKALTAKGQPNGFLNVQVDSGFGLNGQTGTGNQIFDNGVRYFEPVDPRSSRFGMLDSWIQNNAHSIPPKGFSAFSSSPVVDNSLLTRRPGADAGDALYDAFTDKPYDTGGPYWFLPALGWYYTTPEPGYWCYPGLLAQNNPNASGAAKFYYADPDGVVRRASAGNVPAGTATLSKFPSPDATVGLPMASARGTSYPNYSSAYPPTLPARQMDSRPVILNRPFRSVAELGYVYSGTPWRNLDFFMPESGDVAMLDVFCVNDGSDSNGMTAGQVDLNTRQVPVLQAILAGATKDLWNDTTTLAGTAAATIVGGQGANVQAQQIAQLLVTRTTKGPMSGPNPNVPQPLQNVSDLVGRWVGQTYSPGCIGQQYCDGFSADVANFTSNPGTNTDLLYLHNCQRFGESAIRALSNAGQTRVWNLMFDIVAQTGRFPTQATSLDGFNVEGEQHYWVHVAIDRYTGQVIDKQVEVVKE